MECMQLRKQDIKGIGLDFCQIVIKDDGRHCTNEYCFNALIMIQTLFNLKLTQFGEQNVIVCEMKKVIKRN